MKRRSADHCPGRNSQRGGFVLILVLVLVSALALAVHTFSSLAVGDLVAGTNGLQQVRRRHLAESAIEFAAVSIVSSQSAVLVKPQQLSFPDGSEGRFLLLSGLSAAGGSPEYGLQNECSKLNLHTLSLRLSRRKQSRDRLLALPGMTPVIADSIIDWIDEDHDESEFGAEASWYLTRSPPAYPANRPLRTLSELLQVRGMTPELLWGEDANGNGILDPEEDDGEASLPADNADGILDAGLSQWLTLQSAESGLDLNGNAGIWLNGDDPFGLFDAVQREFGTETARYIVAARLNGIHWLDDVNGGQSTDPEIRRLERLEEVRERLRAQLGMSNQKVDRFPRGERGGIVIASPGLFKFRSLLDLFGGTVRAMVEGKDRVLKSPWPADAATIERMLPRLQQIFRLNKELSSPGRVNINTAAVPVLMTIPGVTRAMAEAIHRSQPEPGTGGAADQQVVGWLLRRGLVTPSELRQMAPFITTGGDVYSGIAVGLIAGEPSAAMIHFVLDVSRQKDRIASFQDLPVRSAERLRLPWQKD